MIKTLHELMLLHPNLLIILTSRVIVVSMMRVSVFCRGPDCSGSVGGGGAGGGGSTD